MGKKWAIAVVALLAGALCSPTMKRWLVVAVEAATAGALAEVASTGVVWEVVSTAAVSAEAASTAEDLAAEGSVTLQAAGDLTTEDLAAEDGRGFDRDFGDYGFYGGCDPYCYSD